MTTQTTTETELLVYPIGIIDNFEHMGWRSLDSLKHQPEAYLAVGRALQRLTVYAVLQGQDPPPTWTQPLLDWAWGGVRWGEGMPYLMPLPVSEFDGENAVPYAVVWKFDSDGRCFIVSPKPLPWLIDPFWERKR